MATKTTALTVAAALAGAVSMAGVATPAAAQSGSITCWGISAQGENLCANAAGTHSCAGQSTVDYSYGDWTYVETEEACTSQGGQLEAGEGVNEQLAG